MRPFDGFSKDYVEKGSCVFFVGAISHRYMTLPREAKQHLADVRICRPQKALR